jgi:hypothetical protein
MIRKRDDVPQSMRGGSRRPTAHRAGLYLLIALLAACSSPPSGQSASGAPAALDGKEEATPAVMDTASADSIAPAGGYPAPGESSPSLPDAPKAVTPGGAAYAMFLPVIVNELPPIYPFALNPTSNIAIQGINGCNWIGVGGQIFDLAGTPLQNLVLHLEGIWNGKPIAMEALSGSKPDPYGPAGYEFVLGNQTLDSNQKLWIQVRDATNKAISAPVYINTYNDCTRNLILINFNQVR